ncbi:uncharacterized protein [Amphiura filiformis]|uniref:uncharacterized protein n=1 Tax=Amphiura filiformis TaxID=82378 RepID=UPI003B21FC69
MLCTSTLNDHPKCVRLLPRSVLLLVMLGFGIHAQLLPSPELEEYQAVEWRLTGGITPNEGRLEVRIQRPADPNLWHTICTDMLSDDYLPFVCAAIGFPFSPLPCSMKMVPTVKLPVNDLGQILSVSAQCPITVRSFDDCLFVNLFNVAELCSHDDDVWIRCLADVADVEVRLIDGLYPGDGYVQTRCPNSGDWTTFCSSDWDPRDANVVCKQLGFPYAYGTDPRGSLTSDLGDVVINNVYCSGEEMSIGECRLENLYPGCFNARPGVQCTEYYNAGGVALPICGHHHCADHVSSNPFNNPREYCKCDCACLSMGDCCPDFDPDIHCSLDDPSDHTINGVSIQYYECIGVPGIERDNSGVVLVGKCPDSWTNINTRLNCEIKRDVSDIVGQIPVHDSDKVVYKNIYCALCHGKSMDDVTFWTVRVAYDSFGSNGVIDADLGIYVPEGEFVGYAVDWPDESVRPRSCPFELVDSCSSDFEDAKIISACQSYFAPIYFSDTKYPATYRNPHCALCNGVSENLFTEYCINGLCAPGECSADAPEDECTPSACGRGNHFLTVEALFNFNDLQNDAFGDPNSCPDDDVYDPFLKKCRSLSCPPEFVLVDNTCSPLNPPDPKITETVAKGPTISISGLNCLLNVTGFKSSSEIGATQIITTENRQEITKCVAEDIGCVISETSTVSLAFLFQEDIDLSNFANSIDLILDNLAVSISTCNVTNISAYISFSDKYALPFHCGTFASNSSEIFNITDKHVLSYAQYDFNTTTVNATSTRPSSSCLINTKLNCSIIVSLNESDYIMMTSSNDNSIYLLASNKTLTRDQYLLLADGTILICSSTTSPPAGVSRSVLDITAAVCGWLSVIALIATLITYLVLTSLRNLAGKAVMNLVIALLFGYLGLQLAGFFLISDEACAAWAVVTHFFWIAAFTWMMLFAFNIARTFSRRGVSTRRTSGGSSFWKYFSVGWAIPIVVIAVCIGMHFCNCTPITFHYGSLEENICFLRSTKAVLFAFVVPISVLLFLSITFFIFMAVHLRRQRSASKLARTGGAVEEISYEVSIYLRLSAVIGVTWIFAYLYILIPGSVVVSYIYIILNSLQGVFIFLAFGFTSRVRTMWRNKFLEMTSNTGTKSTGTSTGKSVPMKKSARNEVLNKDASRTAVNYVDTSINNTAL